MLDITPVALRYIPMLNRHPDLGPTTHLTWFDNRSNAPIFTFLRLSLLCVRP